MKHITAVEMALKQAEKEKANLKRQMTRFEKRLKKLREVIEAYKKEFNIS